MAAVSHFYFAPLINPTKEKKKENNSVVPVRCHAQKTVGPAGSGPPALIVPIRVLLSHDFDCHHFDIDVLIGIVEVETIRKDC